MVCAVLPPWLTNSMTLLCVLSAVLLFLPAASTRTCSVLDFGAVGNNKTEDTVAIQSAFASSDCSTVVLPAPGRYLSRPLLLSQHNQTIVLEQGAILVAWPDPNTWSPNSSQSTPALLSCKGAVVGITITGGGRVDGQGWRWWPFGKTRPRPCLINFYNVMGLEITDLVLIDSPAFNIQVRGSYINIFNVTISANASSCGGYASAPNTDGINIGGQHIHVADCFVHNGDDCIPTNVGVNGADTDHVLVERVHCECGTNGGVPIVAEGGTVRNVIYQDMTLFSLNQGAGMKISEAFHNATGLVANITWRRLHIISPRYAAMYTNVFAEDANNCRPPPDPARPHWLTASNLSFIDIVATGMPLGHPTGCFVCSPTRPCSALLFRNVTATLVSGDAGLPYYCFNAHGTSEDSQPVACATDIQ